MSVLLRPLEVADAAELLALLVANRTFLQPFEPVRADRFFTLDEQRALLRTMADDRADDRGYAFAVVERGEGVIVGQVTLSTVVRGAWQNANAGYWIDRARGRRGYATEAVRRAVEFAFGELHLHRVQAGVMPRNLASIRVLEKNGFRREGVAARYLQIAGAWEDHLLFAITRDEWNAESP